MGRVIDVTHPLSAALPTYPGNAPFELLPVKRMARGDSANVSVMHLGTHSGTHVDAPRHFFDAGAGVDRLPLDLLVGRARVVHVPVRRGIGPDDLALLPIAGERRVLLRTANDALWDTSEFTPDYAFLTEEGARYLIERGVAVVGVDYLSVEQFKKPGAPAHHVLLGAGAVIIEGLDLRGVEAGVYEMFCLPLRVADADGAPARVILRTE
jgi:arylformamidase